MTLLTTLTLVHETEECAYYAESLGRDRSPLLGTVTVQKWALPSPTPTAVRVNLEVYEAEQPSAPAPSADATRQGGDSSRAG